MNLGLEHVSHKNGNHFATLDEYIYNRLMIIHEDYEEESEYFINNEILRVFDEVTEEGTTKPTYIRRSRCFIKE